MCLLSGINNCEANSKEDAQLPLLVSEEEANAKYFHEFINICSEKMLDYCCLTFSEF